MIKEKDLLEELRRTRYQDGKCITLQNIQMIFQNQASSNGIPIAFYVDEIKHGGVLSSSSEQCLVMYHPNHQKDYFKYVFTVTYQGNYAFVSIHTFGESYQFGNEYNHNTMKSSIKDAWNSDSGALGVAGVLVGSGLRRIVKGGFNKQKKEEEENWYCMINDMFDDLLN